MVGGDYTFRNVASLRLVIIGFMGRKSDAIDLARIAQRRLVITRSTLRPSSAAENAAIADALRQQM